MMGEKLMGPWTIFSKRKENTRSCDGNHLAPTTDGHLSDGHYEVATFRLLSVVEALFRATHH